MTLSQTRRQGWQQYRSRPSVAQQPGASAMPIAAHRYTESDSKRCETVGGGVEGGAVQTASGGAGGLAACSLKPWESPWKKSEAVPGLPNAAACHTAAASIASAAGSLSTSAKSALDR